MKLTIEELALQILSTCLLINAQGKWHAFYGLSGRVGGIDVRLRPTDYDYGADHPQKTPYKSVAFTSTELFPERTTEEQARQELIDLLSWTQRYLDVEAAA
ncbi:hypothetical protein [Pseudomonas extremaustralis]|uniref:hypothetical protein n=1 Tax=Pseudomonas extremaustralis TaxID=359110 RepID=UPI002865D25E|nr:hypothetical protein [Pseudomonas extremaustralis]MDR6580743.1 hypothetical protein [Pseudomonas extremaustralis]